MDEDDQKLTELLKEFDLEDVGKYLKSFNMELERDLSAIHNEDLLRQMWQQTEDNDYKKEIRSQLYKLRESRLRDLYQGEIMSGNYAKDPLTASHGDSLVGQNFQSLKSKEVRDSVSPTTDLKFHSMTLQHPNTTGWDVQTSSEVSPDGRAYRTETLATTDGVEKINGGTAEFRGRNEQRASASHQGDDKNFVKKASESSNTHLQEHVVIGDENSGRTEVKSSSTTTSSSSHVTSKSSTVEYGGGEPLESKYITDGTNRQQHHDQQQRLTQDQYVQQQQQRQQQLQQQEFEQIKKYQQQQQQEQRQHTEEINRSRQETSTSRNVDTQQTTEQSRRVVDMDKASPEYQQHVQHLMSQPGEIILNTVEYPKPNVKMITTVKRLPDGTIVKNKRYETEELKPTLEDQRQRTTSTTSQSSTQHRNEQQRRQQTEENIYNRQQQNLHNTTTTKRHEHDVVDNAAEPHTRAPNAPHQQQLAKPHHPTEQYTDELSNVETQFSSVKKSSRRFSTETTSETVEEFADQVPSMHAPDVRGKPSQDFSTHGFPSVRPNKLTTEYVGERPHGQTPDFSTQGFPSVKPNKTTQDDVAYHRMNNHTQPNAHMYPAAGKPTGNNVTVTKDGDVVIVSSESTHTSKYKTNAERTTETEVIIEGEHPQKLTATRPVEYPNREQPGAPRRPQHSDTDYTTHGFPSTRDVSKPHTAQPTPTRTINQDGSVTIVNSETKKTIKHNANREHIIETEIVDDNEYRNRPAAGYVRQPDTITFPPTPQPNDFSTHGFPSVRDKAPTNDAYPRQGTPTREMPQSARKPTEDFSTHGFPSVRTPTTNKAAPDYSTPSGGYPSTKNTAAPKLTPTPPSRIQPTSSTTRKTTSTTDSSQRLISKERDVDASHRAFAASLRCSSPADSIDHHQSHQRMTPRSSVSSTRTFRRDGREGSHESDTSRFSTGTVTRSSASKSSLGKTVVTKQTTVTNKARNGSNETIDLTPQRHTKSPSPSKHLPTSTTTRTTITTTSTRKSPAPNVGTSGGVPKTDNKQKLSKPADKNIYPISTINEPPTTLTIKKTHFNDNNASFLANERAAVVEEPIIKEHFYKLGPSDKVTAHVDEKSSPYSPTAPSNHNLHRTHPKSKSPNRDDFEDVYHEEPISHNQPLNSSVIEPKQRNRSPEQGPKNPSQTICQPTKNDDETTSIEEKRRTIVREHTFENNDWQDTILDTTTSNKKPQPVNGVTTKPKTEQPRNDKVIQDDEFDETIDIEVDETLIDTSDFPGQRFFTKKPQTREPLTKKPLDAVNKSPKLGTQREPHDKKPNEKQPTAPRGAKTPDDKKPIQKTATSPTRRTSDVNTSKVSTTTTTNYKTSRNHNVNAPSDEKLPSGRKPSETGKIGTDNEQKSPTRKPTATSTLETVTKKTTRKEHPFEEPEHREPVDESPDERKPTTKRPSTAELSPTRKTTENRTSKFATEKIYQNKYQPDDKPANKGPQKEQEPIKKIPIETEFVPKAHSPTRKNVDTNKLKTTTVTTTITKTRGVNVSPTRESKPAYETEEPMQRKPTKDKIKEPSSVEQTVKPIRLNTSPTRANEPENSEDEYIPSNRKPGSKEPNYNEKATTKSTHVRNVKSQLTTTNIEISNDDVFKPAPIEPSKPVGKKSTEPEYSDDDEQERIRKTTENVTITKTTSYKPQQSTEYEENYEPVAVKPGKESPYEPEKRTQPKKPTKPIEDMENESTTFITTKVKTLRGNEPRYTSTDETQRVEELFNRTNKTKTTQNTNEEFITFERQTRDKTPVSERSAGVPSKTAPLQPQERKPNAKKPSEPRENEPKPTTVESVTEKEHKPSKPLSSEPNFKPTDKTSEPSQSGPMQGKPKLMQPCETDSSDEDDDVPETQKTYETTTITTTREHTRKDKPTDKKETMKLRSPTRKPTVEDENVNTTTTTTVTKNVVGRKPINENELFIEPLEKVPSSDEIKRVEALFQTTSETAEHTKNYNEEFINIESKKTESPDGAFFSKAPEPEPQSPTFKKKGVNPRETFEDRCRQILGMEEYGDTPGVYQKKPDEKPEEKAPVEPVDKETVTINKTEFEVKIEDCEDDEPNYLNNIKEAIRPQKKEPTKASTYKTRADIDISDEDLVEEVECVIKETVVPFERETPEKEMRTESTSKSTRVTQTKIKNEEDIVAANTTTTKQVKKTTTKTKQESVEYQTSESETPDKDTDEESQPDTVVSEREMEYLREQEERTSSLVSSTKKETRKPLKKLADEKRTSVHSSPNTSPTRKPTEPTTPLKQEPNRSNRVTMSKTTEPKLKPKTREPDEPVAKKSSPKSPEKPENKDKPLTPTRSHTGRTPKLDSPTTPAKEQKKPNKETPTSSIKDRLRSATRNKKPSETESDSSPTMSPTRATERRRSSNISVHTEIIIDHAAPKSPKPAEKTPDKHKPQTKKTSLKEREATPTKPFRRQLVTERKESAPVPSVTRKDKNAIMTRSTSEQVVKVTSKQTEVDSYAASSSSPTPRPKAEHRPNKCFTTKTINLTTADKRINAHEMENVIIDIQHAKSSREPSPDKIVPTPVPAHVDTGRPRYPDVVQEPEDEPRKKPIITNIPIFEEESNAFVNCHITEIKTDKISRLVDLEEDDILDNPTIEAPKSLDYPTHDKPEDACLLSVHEKVSKFTHTAEEIKKPKASSPFSREFDKTPKVPENDECLLSVDEKVNKFIKSAEEVAKPSTPVREIERPSYTDLDEELRQDDCTLTVSQKVNKFLSTAEKLAPTTPQRSPELVAKITRTISKQSEPEYPDDVISDDDELTPFSAQHTVEIEKRRQKDILSRPTVFENTTKSERYTKDEEEEQVTTVKRTVDTGEEDDEVIPHTKDHTTKIELKRQRDILSRPSIYDKTPKPRPQTPNKSAHTSPQSPQQTVVTKTKSEFTTTKKISAEDNESIFMNGARKPSTPTSKPDARRSPIKLQTSTVAVTKKRFEVPDNKKATPKSSIESTKTNIRKPSQHAPSTTGRKPSATEPDQNTTSPYKRKPSRESEYHSPQRAQRKPFTETDSEYPRRKPSTETEVTESNDYDSETEYTSTMRRRSSSKTKDYLETVQTEIERFSPTQKEPKRKIPTQEKSKTPTLSQSPTRINGTISTTSKITKVTERTIQPNLQSPDCSDIEIIETIVEQRPDRPIKTHTPTPTTGSNSRSRITSDTVAARRNIFENGATPRTQTPTGSNSPSPVGRRPSYMDHTVSSLEHIRRDSLEVNKQNYSRKSSVESEHNYGGRPNAAVKFDVPQKTQRTTSIPEDIDVENIFELEVLERLLETVTSYELRRRIRAQIRLVKKNLLNTETKVDKRHGETTKTSKSISSTHKASTYTSNVHREETDVKHGEDITTRRQHEGKTSPKRPQTQPKEYAPHETPYGRTTSPKRHDKEEEVTTTEKRYSKIPNGHSGSLKRPTTSSPERAHSPETRKTQGFVEEERRTSASSRSAHHKEYVCSEQTDYAEERYDNSRQVYEKQQSMPRSYSPETKSPTRDGRRIPDSKTKSPASPRTKSPDTGTKPSYQRTSSPHGRTSSPQGGKTSPQGPSTSPQGRTTSPQGRTTSPQSRTTSQKGPSTSPHGRTTSPQRRTSSPQGRTPKQRDEMYTTTKVTTVKTTRSQPERKTSKPTTDENSTPIWADRKNLLKSPSSSPRKVPASPAMRTTASKTITSKSTSQRQTQQNRNIEEDCITSSYGIGPTDENGLPLFGIKALKKKKSSQPCETTEEVTGYVIEEKYYSDNKTKPKVERKEYIYSTNADELEEIKKTVEQSRKSSRDNVDIVRKFEKIEKDYAFDKPDAIMPDTEEFSNTSSKYVRRGSVKELSEKFIRKESTHSTSEKSGYPKAGLILRTSRGSSAEPSGDAYEATTEKYTTTTCNRGQGYRSIDGDSEDEQNVQLRQKQSRRLFSEFDDNESEERHMSTSRSSTKSTRSFLNSSGETKVVTSVDDALERMRNADYVVEAGDTAEDREARSLLNKFLGASVIMSGVESVLPTTKQIKTTRITKTSYADDDADSDILKNKAVKTTRITKTTKSGSSSTPVTRTTCDIEEIWDEEILKELLEQATTYEERRKIRARLRDLMAEREEKKSLKSGEQSKNTPEVDESSASEYEEIIEEVTVSDYSDAEAGEEEDEEEEEEKEEVKKPAENKAKEKAATTKTEIKSKVNERAPTPKSNEKVIKKASNTADESVVKAKSSNDKTNDKGESLVPLLQGILQKSLPKVVAKSLFKTEKVPKEEVKREAEETNKGCNSSSNNSSSNLCTVNNSNNSKDDSSSPNNEHTNNNTTNTTTDLNTQTTTTSESDQERKSSSQVPQDTPQDPETSTMTRDIVMTKQSSNSSTNRPTVNASKQKQLDRLSVPQKEDSGTESGEDLRLIAAGLRDSLHLQSDTNLIEEVTAALARLEQSLKEGNKDLPVDGSKREALLALVARLQTGLTSPEAALNLTNMAGCAAPYDETSSPEAEAQRANRSRFARRRNRNSRHTVGVSREELEDARRYMEDMIMMENISNCTTPESGTLTQAPFFPIEKNPSAGALLPNNAATSTLYRPNQFVPAQLKNTTATHLQPEQQHVTLREKDGAQKGRRPLSGNFTVSFEPSATQTDAQHVETAAADAELHSNGNISPDSGFKSNRFTNKKTLMKRANTIDIPKTKKYNPDFDSDSEPEEQAPQLGLKRALQVNVKHKVRTVIPPFVPKTENDHKFLAFINKQSDKPGLGWAGARSVSNWTNKFGNLKHAFEVGAAAQSTTGKPPQAPGHVPHNAAKNYWQKQVATQDYHQQQQQQQYLQYQQQQQQQQQQLQRNQQEAHERQRRLERERFERERIERDRLERQRLERERQERDRLEQAYYEREIAERERLATAQHAAMPSMTSVPKPAPVNKFKHAPQSVFRPIDNNDTHKQNIFKPIPQLPQKANTWQPPSQGNASYKPLSAPAQIEPASPQFLSAKQTVNSTTQHARSPSSNASSPIGLPWVAKPAVDNSDFRKKAYNFEERAQNDNRSNSYLQRHHSLRSPKMNHPINQMDEYKKRPSLPSTTDPYMAAHSQYVPYQQHQQPQVYASANDVYAQPAPPPPTNISFTYADLPRTSNYKSYPCLPSAVETSISAEYARQRESSLTNPNAIPLVLTNSNPTYEPPVEPRKPYHNGAPQALKQFEYASPMDSAPASPSMFTLPHSYYTDDDLDSDNLMEYRAETRVMGKPKSQTAVTVRDRRTAHASDDEVFGKNSRNAHNLLHTMKNIGRNGNGALKVKKEPVRKVESPKGCLSPDGRAYQAPIVEPLFPQLTKFEPNRTPEYIEDPIINQVVSKPQKTRPKTPPIPNQQMDRSLQLARAEEQYRREREQQKHVEKARANYANVSKTTKLQHQQQQLQQQQTQYQSNVSNTTSTSSVPYVSETQPAYVVTYPTEEKHAGDYARQPPTTLPLQRSRNTSDNSTTSSSISHNIPSPGTNWTANPIHAVDEVLPQRKQSLKSVDTNSLTAYQSQSYAPPTQKQNVPDLTPAKPKTATKKTPTNSQYVTLTSTYQQQYAEPPQAEKPLPPPRQTEPQAADKPIPEPRYAAAPFEKPQAQPRHVGTEKPQPQPRTKAPSSQERQQQPAAQATQPPPQMKAAPKLVTRSQKFSSSSSTQSQSFDQHYAPQSKVLSRQRTLDAASITPIQTQNRVLSQQSLVSSKQRQFEQHDEDVDRRKSLGNVFDVQKQQRKTASSYITESKAVYKQEYKSSAPPDTPDIVKSSLPKDDMPILKKFGPPQRHHYVPNSYQSPATANTQKQKYESSTTKVIKNTQHEIVQHSTLTKKPSIVEIPATPQPDQAEEDLIPRNIVFKNISAFTSLSRRHEQENGHQVAPPRVNRLSKSDSWNQIVQIQNQANAQLPPTSPKFGANSSSSSELRRTKSGHTLNVRMYEAGLDKSEIEQQATSTTETKEKDGAVVTTTTKVTTRTVTGSGGSATKPVSPFAKFRQLDKQSSQQSPKSPSTPTTPGVKTSPSGSARIFQFTDPALNARAATAKEQLLQWCQSKTQEYENIKITNFSASWSDGLAFCALIHHFLPDAFDYSKLTPKSRRQNFELAFTVADEKAGIAPLLDVEDMVEMSRPDWKCVFIYVQSIYRRFRNCQ